MLVAVAVLLGSLSPAARAQDGAGAERPAGGGRGPEALWDAYPLEERPRDAGADGERAAGAPSSPQAVVRTFQRQEPAGTSWIMVATLLCVFAGLVLTAAGLLSGARGAGSVRRGRLGRSGP
jgi:hypothetical protein